jgi:hypothetical protein
MWVDTQNPLPKQFINGGTLPSLTVRLLDQQRFLTSTSSGTNEVGCCCIGLSCFGLPSDFCSFCFVQARSVRISVMKALELPSHPMQVCFCPTIIFSDLSCVYSQVYNDDKRICVFRYENPTLRLHPSCFQYGESMSTLFDYDDDACCAMQRTVCLWSCWCRQSTGRTRLFWVLSNVEFLCLVRVFHESRGSSGIFSVVKCNPDPVSLALVDADQYVSLFLLLLCAHFCLNTTVRHPCCFRVPMPSSSFKATSAWC